uniref:CUB domain-containing protein n=1 Tax=Haemonchus placei TaxID=6290 RepID=A0A0N4WTH7_HAEPC
LVNRPHRKSHEENSDRELDEVETMATLRTSSRVTPPLAVPSSQQVLVIGLHFEREILTSLFLTSPIDSWFSTDFLIFSDVSYGNGYASHYGGASSDVSSFSWTFYAYVPLTSS